MRRSAAAIVLILGLIPSAKAEAFRDLEIGAKVPNRKMPTLDGKSATLLGNAKANVFVFFRTEHDRSAQVLRQLAALEQELASKPVRFVGVVSSEDPKDAVAALVRDTGIRMAVLVDDRDALYGELGVMLYPSIGIADARHTLAGYQPFRQLNFTDSMRGRIQRVLGEIDEAQLAAILDPPSNPVEVNRAKARLNLARKLLDAGDVDGAIASARKAVELEPDGAAAHAVLAEMLARGGKCAEASRESAAARKLDAAIALPPACTAR